MAIKPESQFIKSVHAHLGYSVYSMKNHNEFVSGVPDVWYSGGCRDLWVEYKYSPVTFFRKSATPELSNQQLLWIRGRQEEGRNVWAILGYKKGGIIFRTWQEMVAGIDPIDVPARTLSRQELTTTIVRFVHGLTEIP